MKIIHFSDTHLGHGDYTAIDPESELNQREIDIYKVFREIIDYIIEAKPDLVIHAGDLFDNIRPSNKAISEALEQFARLSKADIPTVIIAGNHSTPRQRSKETIFKILDYFENIYPIYGGKYKKIIIGDCAIHAIPHTYSDQDLEENVRIAKPDKNYEYNILVTHGVIRGIKEASWGEFKEQTIPDNILHSDFDYIALGHLHSCQEISKNAYYSGSPERLSFNEANQKKYFLEINLKTKSVRKIPTNTREMKVFDSIDCEKLTPEQVIESIQSRLENQTEGKIIRMTFDNIPRHVYSSLDHQKIHELTKNSTHFEPVFHFKDEDSTGGSSTSIIGTLDEEFETFLKKKEITGKEFTELRTLGLEYLGRIEEEVNIE